MLCEAVSRHLPKKHAIPQKLFSAKNAGSHTRRIASQGRIKAPWDILETLENNNFLKCIQYFRPKRNMGCHCDFAQ